MQLLKKFFQREKPVDNRVDLNSRFELKSKMGLGTMSQVWKAVDRQKQDVVAIKIIDTVQLEKVTARFPKGSKPSEGAIAISLHHPHIVKTIQYGMSKEDKPFLVMEYIEGLGLSQFIETQNEMMKNNCLKWIIQIGEALQYIHEQDFIHRDLCPRNIIVNHSGEIKLIDFGLSVPNADVFRAPGNRTGTADYMAPELVKRQRTDQRIDLYSYAVTCYQMCANHLPFPPGKNVQTIIKNLNRPPMDIKQFAPDLPGSIAGVIFRGLAKDPNDRWQSAEEMTDAFKKIAASL